MDDGEVRELRTALQMLQRRLRREVLSGHGLTRTPLSVLAALLRGAETPGALARGLQLTSSNVAAALRELETDGYVTRAPDAADGRRTLVRLTDAGEAVIGEVRAERETWLGRAIVAELDDDEQQVLRRATALLGRLARVGVEEARP